MISIMLVCASIYQACKVFELFSKTDQAMKCAIVTSYQPSAADIKGEDSGEGMNEELRKYDVYRKMLAEFFEEPGSAHSGGVLFGLVDGSVHFVSDTIDKKIFKALGSMGEGDGPASF